MEKKYWRSSPTSFSFASSAGAKDRSRSTTFPEGQDASTFKKTCAGCARGATGNYTTCPEKKGCQRDKSSTQSDFMIRFPTPRERWPAYAIVLLSATALSAYRIGLLIGDAAISFLLTGKIR